MRVEFIVHTLYYRVCKSCDKSPLLLTWIRLPLDCTVVFVCCCRYRNSYSYTGLYSWKDMTSNNFPHLLHG